MNRDVQGKIQRLDESVREFLLLRLTGEAGRLARQVAADWREVSAVLEDEQSRPTRPCPHCSQLGMWNATRCGYCWRALEPLPETAAQADRARGGGGQGLAALATFEGEGGALEEGGHGLQSH